ncbi:MAG TPA: hypothetical protein VNM48_22480 [Chloroflexota bacterium]|nr:hypothetical protein [Chloroflexota bacterium]
MTTLHVNAVYLKGAVKQARKYVKDVGEDLASREPSDAELTAAVTAVAQAAVDSLLQDLSGHLNDFRTTGYEEFERALFKAMGDQE